MLGLLCMLPVVTIFASITAMHFVNFKLAIDKDINVPREFFKSFKQNLLQSIPLLILFALVGGLLVYAWINNLSSENTNSLLVIMLSIASIIYLSLESVATYLLAKFDNTTKRLLLLTIYAVGAHIDIVFKLSLVEATVIAIPVLIYIINPGVSALIAALIVCFVLLILFEVLSGKWIDPIFATLLKSNEKKLQDEATESDESSEGAESENVEDLSIDEDSSESINAEKESE